MIKRKVTMIVEEYKDGQPYRRFTETREECETITASVEMLGADTGDGAICGGTGGYQYHGDGGGPSQHAGGGSSGDGEIWDAGCRTD